MNGIFLLIFLFSKASSAADFDEDAFYKSRCEPKCIFNESEASSQTAGSFPTTCTTVCADFSIGGKSNLTEQQLTTMFQNMKHLVGGLLIYRTKYTSAKFLAGLETVECGRSDFVISYNMKLTELGLTNLTSLSCSEISFSSNEEIKNLNMPHLKTITRSASAEVNDTEVHIRIDGGTYGFCISTVEMLAFLSADDVDLERLEGKLCEPPVQPIVGKQCNASISEDTPTDLQDGCTQYFGKLVITPENVKDVSKLNSVETIFGPLIIQKTNLTTIDFLGSLKYMTTLGFPYPAMLIQNNPYLSNFSFPSFKHFKNGEFPYSVVFENNSQELVLDPSYCYYFSDRFGSKSWQVPRFDGKSCLTLQMEANMRPAYRSAMPWIGMKFWTIFVSVSLVSQL